MPTNDATKRVRGKLYTSDGAPICSTRPSFSTTMRSEIDNASSWSCVTKMEVMPNSRCSVRISSRRETRILASSADKGSSSSSTWGLLASARARATRCCWPPDNCHGYRPASGVNLINVNISSIRARTCSVGIFATFRPKPILSATVIFGNNAYDWNTMPMLRWLVGSQVTSRPSNLMTPADGDSKPAIMRRMVVLPHPEGPRKVTNSPRCMSMAKSWTAVWLPKSFLRAVISRKAIVRFSFRTS